MTAHIHRIAAFVLVVLFTSLGYRWAGHVNSASVGCKLATLPVERAICASPDLRAWDRNIADEYQRALESADPDQKAVIQEQQKRWLLARDIECGVTASTGLPRRYHVGETNACLIRAYADREKQIGTIEPKINFLENGIVPFPAKSRPFAPTFVTNDGTEICRALKESVDREYFQPHLYPLSKAPKYRSNLLSLPDIYWFSDQNTYATKFDPKEDSGSILLATRGFRSGSISSVYVSGKKPDDAETTDIFSRPAIFAEEPKIGSGFVLAFATRTWAGGNSNVVYSAGHTYLLWDGHPEIPDEFDTKEPSLGADGRIALFRLESDGRTIPSCVIQVTPNAFPGTEAAPFQAFVKELSASLALLEDKKECPGPASAVPSCTLSTRNHASDRNLLLTDALAKPWELNRELAWNGNNQKLTGKSFDNIPELREAVAGLPEARKSLSDYYQSTFGLSPEEAAAAAERVCYQILWLSWNEVREQEN